MTTASSGPVEEQQEAVRMVPADSCDCPLIAGSHRYGDGCMTACPFCDSIPRCEHDDDGWLDELRQAALTAASRVPASGDQP